MTDARQIRIENQSDGVDESGVLLGEQFSLTHDVDGTLVDTWHELIVEEGEPSGPLDQIEHWPESFDEAMGASLEAAATVSEAAAHLQENFKLWSSKVVVEAYTRLTGAYTKEQIPDVDFQERSGRPLLEGIESGHDIVVSRVLESNVDWLVRPLEEHLSRNPDSDSRVCVQLSSVDTLPLIAREEIEHVRETDKELEEARGISRHKDLTAFRHLTLWAGTLRGLIYLKRRHGSRVEVRFMQGPPRERGNLVVRPNGVSEAFCVGLEEWDIGLDSAFYEIVAPEARHAFYDALQDQRTSSQTLNDLESILAMARELQHRFLDVEVNSTQLRQVLTSIVRDSEDSDIWEEGPSGSTGLVESLEALEDEDILSSIQRYQERIDGGLLPEARRRLEE